MFRKSILGVVALATIALVGALAAPAGAGGVTGSVTSQQVTPTTAVIPLQGDFNGDGADDILWYGRGTTADSMWFNSVLDPTNAIEESSFTVKAVTINGNYDPAVGDFNGDGRDDIFWYQAGTGQDSVWYWNADQTFTSVAQVVNGAYRPIVGNFDTVDAGNATEQDDIFWYPLARGNSSLSTGNTNKTFTTRAFGAQAPRDARSLMGEFELGSAQPSPDIYFYVAGSRADSMWVSDGTGNFERSSVPMNGTYRPIVGDFDTQGTERDLPSEVIAAYGDSVDPVDVQLDAWADQCFAGTLASCDSLQIYVEFLGGTYSQYHTYSETCAQRRSPGPATCAFASLPAEPVGLSDIVWHGPGANPDKVWLNAGDGGFVSSNIAIATTVLGTVIPNGDGGTVGGDRILWNAPAGNDTLWVPTPGGATFGSSPIPEMGASRKPLVGEWSHYSGVAQHYYNEVLWYAPGNTVPEKEHLWFAGPNQDWL